MTENFNIGMPQGRQIPPQFNPQEYLTSMGIPQDIISKGDNAIRKYAEENGINLVPKGQVPQQPPKAPIPMVAPGNPTTEVPGEISYQKEPNPPQKASRFQMVEYFNKRMEEIANDLKMQGASNKEIKKTLKRARKDVWAEANMKFEKMSPKEAKAWLKQKETELQEQNPNMSKKEIKKQAKLAYQETFGENPPHGFWHNLITSIPIIGTPLSIIDDQKNYAAQRNYKLAHLSPEQQKLVELGIPAKLVASNNDNDIMRYAQKHNINLPY